MEYKDYILKRLDKLESEYDVFQKNRTFVISGISIIITLISSNLEDKYSYILIALTLIYLLACIKIEIPLFTIKSKEAFNSIEVLEKASSSYLKKVSTAYKTFAAYTTLYVLLILLVISIAYIPNQVS